MRRSEGYRARGWIGLIQGLVALHSAAYEYINWWIPGWAGGFVGAGLLQLDPENAGISCRLPVGLLVQKAKPRQKISLIHLALSSVKVQPAMAALLRTHGTSGMLEFGDERAGLPGDKME